MNMKNTTWTLWMGTLLLLFAIGCASSRHTEEMLTEAGFKIMPADSPERQAHLKSLANHKISKVERDGKEYFVYPDAGRNVLYVGQESQYQKYQQLREAHQMSLERANSNLLLSDPGWNVWGPWPDTAYTP